jgi:hypothetical protein
MMAAVTHQGPRGAIGLLMLALFAGCGGGHDSNPVAPSPSATTVQQYASAHFTFQYSALDAASIADTAARVEAEYARIVSDLGSPNVSRITVVLHETQASIQAAAQNIGGTVATVTGFVQGPATVHALSPNLAVANLTYVQGIRTIVHEFAHCVSLHVNPAFGNNPRWLWESVAVYESGDFVDPRHVQPMVSGQPPSLARLNGFDNGDVYLVGYTIGEFIVSRWGRDGLVALIRNHGETTQVTGLSQAAFLAEWYAFVRARYLIG